jgi:hypothetical protein
MTGRPFSLVCVIYGVNEHKKGHKKGQFEPAGLGKLFAKHFSIMHFTLTADFM